MPDLGCQESKPFTKAGGWRMATDAHLRASDGLLVATTHTWSAVKFTGFHGAVQASVYDANNVCIAVSQKHVYGVDGVWIGNHDRTDTWSQTFGPDVGSHGAKVAIVHSWNPDWLTAIVNTINIGVTLLEAIIQAFSSADSNGSIGVGGEESWPSTALWNGLGKAHIALAEHHLTSPDFDEDSLSEPHLVHT
jgi:hypothetical protein